MIKALIFDLDDTLYYEKEYVLGAFKEVAAYLGNKYNESFEEIYTEMTIILDTMGRGQIFDIICDKHGFDEKIEDLVDIYRASKPKLKLYDDSKEVMVWARNAGYKLGIITDGCVQVQKNKVEALEINKYVDCIVLTDELGREFWKPNEKPYKLMLKELEVSADECVYIGDNPVKDFIGARKLGLRTIRIIRENGDHISKRLGIEFEADDEVVNLKEIKELI
ncbi:HAD family hydrolase [Inconstantimicrobium mannanitabidum]|uniref:Haloacid dehalogenase n=1 Tax=Inconstantimicrobium mannanitabidum TaxID=1604901 RepID=A0ACB5R8F7_9CLOT|nr:HAD-IA family hydrolase [Clostridium sp. TW13]GKX65475.1 haloacid dehalogenase [Clostridium sp. TW13]